jgi:hypothetical protein
MAASPTHLNEAMPGKSGYLNFNKKAILLQPSLRADYLLRAAYSSKRFLIIFWY